MQKVSAAYHQIYDYEPQMEMGQWVMDQGHSLTHGDEVTAQWLAIFTV